MARFTVAVNTRWRLDSGEWADGEPTFFPVTVWAEHVVESLAKDSRVVVLGTIKSRSWTPTEGERAGQTLSRLEVTAEAWRRACSASDAELLQLWVDGHREGLGELVDRHHGWLLRVMRLLSVGEKDPEAVVQDVWLDVMRGARTYRGSGSVRSWLETIVRRRISGTWRARNARPQRLVDEVPEDAGATTEFVREVVVEDLRGLLARLPDDQGEAVWLVDVVGLAVDEAAAGLGVPAGTIKSRCHRGRTRLRLLLGARS